MKKIIVFLVTALCIVGLAVSCSNDVATQNATDETFSVAVGQGKTLVADGGAPIQVEGLYWYYLAFKTDGAFITGQKTELTPVHGEGIHTQGLTGVNLGKFSKGGWRFHFVGYADPLVDEETQQPVYYDGEGTIVTVTADTELAIVLEKGAGMPATGITASAIMFYTGSFNPTATFKLVVLDGLTPVYQSEYLEQHTVGDVRCVSFAIPQTELSVGNHLLKFQVFTADISDPDHKLKVGDDDLLLAVGQGVTYSIIGFVDVVGDETYDVTVGSYSLSEPAGVGGIEPGKTIRFAAAPDTSEGAASTTSVSFPEGFEGEEGVEYALAAKITTLAGAPDEPTGEYIFDGNYSAVAALDLTLYAGSEEIALSGNSIDVVTYIQPGLGDNVKVKYDGTDIQGVDGCSYVYDSDTGILTMHITHFSTYVAEFEGIAVDENGDAVEDEAALLSLTDETIKLMKNIELDDVELYADDLVITLNGKMINPKKFSLGAGAHVYMATDHLRVTTAAPESGEFEFGGGSGTEQIPYMINTEFALRYLAAYVNAGYDTTGIYFRQTADIDLRYDTWTPIGQGGYRVEEACNTYFKGIYDGNGSKVLGMTNEGYDPDLTYKSGRDGNYSYGMFGLVDGASIHDLIIEDARIITDADHAGDSVGAVVGYAKGESFRLEACSSIEREGGAINGFDAVGGILGRYYGNGAAVAFIEDCLNELPVTGSEKVGGIAGFINASANGTSGTLTVTGCRNIGDVYSTTHKWHAAESGHYLSMTGGILCFGQSSSKNDTIVISYNTNSGKIKQDIASYAAYIATAGNFQNADPGDVFEFENNTNVTPLNYWFGNSGDFTGDYIVDDPLQVPVQWYLNPDYDLIRVSGYGDVSSNADRPIAHYAYTDPEHIAYGYSSFPGLDRWPSFVPSEHRGFYTDAETD